MTRTTYEDPWVPKTTSSVFCCVKVSDGSLEPAYAPKPEDDSVFTVDLDKMVENQEERLHREQRMMLQKMHSEMCIQRDKDIKSMVSTSVPSCYFTCTNEACLEMKRLLKHQKKCRKGDKCLVQDCTVLRAKAKHFQKCVTLNCQGCGPVRKGWTEFEDYNRIPITLHLLGANSIFSGYKADPFYMTLPPMRIITWRQQVPMVLREHLEKNILKALTPHHGSGIHIPQHILEKEAGEAENQIWKESKDRMEYFARIVLKIDASLRILLGKNRFQLQLWNPMIPNETRNSYVIRIFNALRLPNSVENEQRLGQLLCFARNAERQHFLCCDTEEKYFKAINKQAQRISKDIEMLLELKKKF
ncbi:hypothetical protein L3Y34_016947 [Caenorhabditis briggsae]|uniref:TAZ-type domain-containing protein n=2 Tax=Caenorhabditis briggsae TaxID=6238 RepID=A0AAE9DHU5_CAEBR|nr:hypothetical protein L3Y34_016947 [Caenorhabditis briggsae]